MESSNLDEPQGKDHDKLSKIFSVLLYSDIHGRHNIEINKHQTYSVSKLFNVDLLAFKFLPHHKSWYIFGELC